MIARPYFFNKQEEIPWLKARGYLHITPQLDVVASRHVLVGKVTNPAFVAKHAFFPLIHSVVRERRFKKVAHLRKRCHSYQTPEGHSKRSEKIRPLHYASHFDSLIFGYYAEILQRLYEEQLSRDSKLSECIIAYRRIKSATSETNKSTIHFAKEVFDYIKNAGSESCIVLMFDIRSYFSSIDHELLKDKWAKLLGTSLLPSDHYNVFKAATQFSYILLDDLRLKGRVNGRRRGFDERKLSQIRKQSGVFSFYESPKEFRDHIRSRKLRVHRYPFRNKHGKPIGIPQGLPLSATLANMYLIDFDIALKNKIVDELCGFYRRYSDDIIVVCKPGDADFLEQFILSAIIDSKVEISTEKTDKYMFRYLPQGFGAKRLTSIKLDNDRSRLYYPLSYLGFEFYGDKTLVKSANLARFYRRMVFSVKRKARKAVNTMVENPYKPFVLYRSQLKKLYSYVSLKKTKVQRSKKFLVKNEFGNHRIRVKRSEKSLRSNYMSYIRKASVIMNEPLLNQQVKGHMRVFNQAVQKHCKIRE